MKTNKKYSSFLFLSDAIKFQAKMRKQGYKTRIIHKLGISNPTRIVKYFKPQEA